MEKKNGQINVTDALKLAKSSCKRCYGRGVVGIDPERMVRLLCRCVSRHIQGLELVQDHLNPKPEAEQAKAEA